MTGIKVTKLMVILAGCLAPAWLVGCQRIMNRSSEAMVAHTLEVSAEADLERKTEVQLVEQMGGYRAGYKKHLELLRDFYERQGNHLKSRWSMDELAHLDQGPRHSYLVVAETAGPDLRASTAIVEADLMFQEGMKYYQQGRGKLATFFAQKNKLYLAIDKFNELITTYPDSDKIDDAAFQAAEIYNHYLKNYHKALLYYQRVWQWDFRTPYPARYAVARIYDDRLHDRVKALEYYQLAVNMESAFPDKAEYSQSRINAISRELTAE